MNCGYNDLQIGNDESSGIDEDRPTNFNTFYICRKKPDYFTQTSIAMW